MQYNEVTTDWLTAAKNNTGNILESYDTKNKCDRCNQKICPDFIEQIKIMITKTGNRYAIARIYNQRIENDM